MTTASHHLLRPLFIEAGGGRVAKPADWSSGKVSPAAYPPVQPLHSQHPPSFRPSPGRRPRFWVSVKGHGAHSSTKISLPTPEASRSTGQHRMPHCTAEGSTHSNTASEQEPTQSILNLPTCLTLARVLAVPLLAAGRWKGHERAQQRRWAQYHLASQAVLQPQRSAPHCSTAFAMLNSLP